MALWRSQKKLPLDELKRVDGLYEEGKLDEAHELAHTLLEAYSDGELHRKLYEISEKRGDAAEAAEHLKAYLSQMKTPETAKVFRLAELLMAAGQINKARKELERVLDRQPDNSEAQALVARAFRLEGDLQQAALRVERLVTRDPECLPARKERVFCRIAARDHEGAYREMIETLGGFKDDAEFLEALGKCAYLTGRYAPAKRALKRVLKMEPTRVNARYYLGCVRLEMGSKRRGLALLEEAAKELPETEELLHQLYRGALEVGDAEKAYRYFLQYSTLMGKDASVWKQAGEEFLGKGAKMQAADAFRHAYYVDNEDVGCACKWLELQMEMGDQESTMRFLEDAVARHPRAVELLLLLAQGTLNGGDATKARELIEKAASIDATHPRVSDMRTRVEEETSKTS